MPTSSLPPVFPTRPLNLNEDGTTINYTKSHTGPNAAHWIQADLEEMARLFNSGTLRPILPSAISSHKIATYVNPVCVEKSRDDGSLKFRTRATIGGDLLTYDGNTSAVTADLESIKILLNVMISENAYFSTVDLEDFCLGAPLNEPEYIRIPTKFIPAKALAFFRLMRFLRNGAVYCEVLKTHYDLPQAGALSQTLLFHHLAENGYIEMAHSPVLFRNQDGSI